MGESSHRRWARDPMRGGRSYATVRAGRWLAWAQGRAGGQAASDDARHSARRMAARGRRRIGCASRHGAFTAFGKSAPCLEVKSLHSQTGDKMKNKVLMLCGILAPVVYVITVILGGFLWPGYSHVSQPVSDLIATGAPNKSLLDPACHFTDGFLVQEQPAPAWIWLVFLHLCRHRVSVRWADRYQHSQPEDPRWTL